MNTEVFSIILVIYNAFMMSNHGIFHDQTSYLYYITYSLGD